VTHTLVKKNSQLHYQPVLPWEKNLDEPKRDSDWEMKIKNNSNDCPPSSSNFTYCAKVKKLEQQYKNGVLTLMEQYSYRRYSGEALHV
jgi:hypothetical protein